MKSGAQRLIDTYKTGPRQNVTILEEAKRQYDIANNKIGFIRNQLIRVKQHSENAQQVSALNYLVCLGSPSSRCKFLHLGSIFWL